ncbi:erythromycin esterase family protein [Allokutzneria albata]|uniref:erythromycin esterase family protein n=1 Tax=Allokutzneria albata TaxID=211114 RepID=UPI0004C36121|nr:erythromycin esterase family protein [Allokutzneria albata]
MRSDRITRWLTDNAIALHGVEPGTGTSNPSRTPSPECGTGTARPALAAVGFWTWHTEEVLELVEWLRAHNATLPRDQRVRFRGIDPLDEPGADQWTRDRAAEINALPALSAKGSALRDRYMTEAVQRIAPDDKVIVWVHNG